ncbi:hypothetical protein ABIE35_004279, partial [Paenarthrobacter sp. 4246]
MGLFGCLSLGGVFGWLKGKSPDLWSGLLPNGCPAVSYS